MFRAFGLMILLLIGFGVTPAQARTFTYALFDHPAGGAVAFSYGVRLDHLGRYFSFENGGAVTLTYDNEARRATVSGTLRESLGNGHFGDIWSITYEWTDLIDLGQGKFKSNNGAGTGRIELGLTSLALGAKVEGAYDFVFLDDGHRLGGFPYFARDSYVGRGWIDPSPNLDGANDFLFTARISPVPLPAGIWLLITGLLALRVFNSRGKGRHFTGFIACVSRVTSECLQSRQH